MRLPLSLAAAVLALSALGCVSEQTQQPTNGWELTSDTPQVSLGPRPTIDGRPAGVITAPDDDEDLLSLLTPASPADLDPDFLADQPPSPFHRLGPNVIRGLDGSWTKMYTVRAGRGLAVVELLKAYVPGFPSDPNTPNDPELPPNRVIRWVLHESFVKDDMLGGAVPPSFGEAKVEIGDVLHVTAPPETLLFVTELLHKVLGDLPQIELQVRVVEVNLDDELDWEAKTVIRQLENVGLPFNPETNPQTGKFGSGVPILDDGVASGIGAGFNSFSSQPTLSGFLLSLQGVHDNIIVDTALSLLQTIGAAEIINAPSITVLNGHRARLSTGDQVPVFSASGNVNNPNVTTSFEPTGVSIEIVPFIVSEDLIRVDLSIDVSAQTGSVPYVISGVDVSSPIISQRTAATTVHVYHEQVFALGGLRGHAEIETITKVPLLGDIPLLGWLFKSRNSSKRNTEILFFITPRILIPSEILIDPLGS